MRVREAPQGSVGAKFFGDMANSSLSPGSPVLSPRARPRLGLAAAAAFALALPVSPVAPVAPVAPVSAAGQDTATPTVEVGQPAPDFELRDAGGESYRLSELVAKGPVVLEFFRSGGW